MAKVINTKRPRKVEVRRVKKREREVFGDTSLPMKDEMPSSNIFDFAFLIHGEKKIGKTTLVKQCGNVFFFQFDRPQKAYKRKERVIVSWKQFTTLLTKLEDLARSGKFPYDAVCVDGVDAWYQMALRFACRKLGIEHPQDEDYGKGWSAVKQLFTESVDRILKLPCGRWFIAHSVWREVDTREGTKIQKLIPQLGSQAEQQVNGRVDGWFAYAYSGGKRVLVVLGDEKTGAGHGLDEEGNEHFRTPKGKWVREVPMGDSPKEAYKNLLRAFNNKQKRTRVGEGVTPPPKKKPFKK